MWSKSFIPSPKASPKEKKKKKKQRKSRHIHSSNSKKERHVTRVHCLARVALVNTGQLRSIFSSPIPFFFQETLPEAPALSHWGFALASPCPKLSGSVGPSGSSNVWSSTCRCLAMRTKRSPGTMLVRVGNVLGIPSISILSRDPNRSRKPPETQEKRLVFEKNDG